MSENLEWKKELSFLGGSPQEEAQLFELFREEIQQVQEHFRQSNGGIRRGLHAKTLVGTTKAQFRVASDIPSDLQLGFLQPGKVYDAHVRFSNASSEVNSGSDSKPPDLRGVALRVRMGPNDQGRDHDFLMTNAEPHHARNAHEAMDTTVAFTQEGWLTKLLENFQEPDGGLASQLKLIKGLAGKVEGVKNLVFRVGPLDAFRIISTLTRQMKIPVESLATETYWSRAPIAFGPVALKYRLEPVLQKSANPTPEDNLRRELADRLRALGDGEEVQFEFQIQRYRDHRSTPIEDSSKQWDSPFQTIAILALLKQDLNTNGPDADERAIDDLQFNPWNVNTDEFVPIGNMNRARKPVYQASVAFRTGKG
ncbi:MAG TPA: hypothetical protein VF553_14545 [Pyrinomonadaceae bacterium]|jgi:hypothetical protein